MANGSLGVCRRGTSTAPTPSRDPRVPSLYEAGSWGRGRTGLKPKRRPGMGQPWGLLVLSLPI